MKKMLFTLVAVLVTHALATPAAAQERFGGLTNEVSLTYSFLRDDGENAKAGMVFDYGRRLKGNVSLIGEGAFNHFADFDETMVQAGGGLRLGVMSDRRIRPYIQTIVGVQRVYGANGFNVQPGGGVRVGLTRMVDARVQLDFPMVRWEGETYRQFRLSAGMGLPLGGGRR